MLYNKKRWVFSLLRLRKLLIFAIDSSCRS
jgi:hypothetical protein